MIAQGSIDLAGLRELADKFEATSEYCKKNNVHIKDNMLEAMLAALDLDGNGVLDMEETVGIFMNRKQIGSQKMKD